MFESKEEAHLASKVAAHIVGEPTYLNLEVLQVTEFPRP